MNFGQSDDSVAHTSRFRVKTFDLNLLREFFSEEEFSMKSISKKCKARTKSVELSLWPSIQSGGYV